MTDTVKTRSGILGWLADLAMGFRFAVAGGRAGWVRAGLTALGVGLGVAMLLVAASIPNVVAAADQRSAELQWADAAQKSDSTVLLSPYLSSYRDLDISGAMVQAEGTDPALPPGIDEFPEPGEMYVSPKLAELLASEEGELLRPRLDYDTAGVIADEGLYGPGDLRYYAGSDSLDPDTVVRLESFGVQQPPPEEMPAILVLLVLVAITIMLLPVVMFVAVAVRFGGERRDRRLAALRLVGADGTMARRMAAGESLLGALGGLLLGVVVFEVAVRLLVEVGLMEAVTSGNVSIFAYDVDPDPAFAAIIAIAVPLVAIVATQLSMRSLVVEPLGVVRQAKPRRRRLWWRLVLVAVGVAALLPTVTSEDFSTDNLGGALVVVGVLALLLGMAAMLPWLVEVIVGRFRGGAPSLQMATRRLQLGGGSATRAIIGVAVAAAGAIALHMLFAAVEADQSQYTGQQGNQGELSASGDVTDADAVAEGVDDLAGVQTLSSYMTLHGSADNEGYSVVVADCEQLAKLAKIRECDKGDVFGVNWQESNLEAGQQLEFWGSSGYQGEAVGTWSVPKPRDVVSVSAPSADIEWTSMLATPEAMNDKVLGAATHNVVFELESSHPDTVEHVRNFAAQQTPQWDAYTFSTVTTSSTFANLRSALYVGVVATMMLIGLSLLVNTIEQLQERRRIMSVLVAFGTRRRSLVLSVLWQTAVPVVCGLLVSTATGLGLGAMLVTMTGDEPKFDWASVGTINGLGAAMALAVTLLSVPALWQMMRPDGIRTE